jgi:hypothetical protein
MPRLSVPGFVDGSNTERSPQAQIGRTINEFVESTQPGGGTKAPGYLQGTPGIHPLLVWPAQPIRGLFTMNERAFVVGGGLFGEFFADGTIGTTYPVTNDGARCRLRAMARRGIRSCFPRVAMATFTTP